MREGPRGFAPARDFLGAQLERLPQFHEPGQPRFTTPRLHGDTSSRDGREHGRRVRYDLKEYDELLDSSNMSLRDWARIAEDIEGRYDDYDAFVVPSTAPTRWPTRHRRFSFMLENLGKTVVILIGSQIPLALLRNDAVDNLLGALILAGHYAIPEVCLYFRNKLPAWQPHPEGRRARLRRLRLGQLPAARRRRDRHSREVAPHPEGSHEEAPGPHGDGPARWPRSGCSRASPPASSRSSLRPPLRGLVLETYGTGNAPDRRKDFLAALARATARGVVIVSCTQCHTGRVSEDYAAGKALGDAGRHRRRRHDAGGRPGRSSATSSAEASRPRRPAAPWRETCVASSRRRPETASRRARGRLTMPRASAPRTRRAGWLGPLDGRGARACH